MPIYTYRCTAGHRTERMRAIRFRDGIATCTEPGCHEPAARVPDAPGFVLRGAGFHAVDYPRERAREGQDA